MRTIDDILSRLPRSEVCPLLPPTYEDPQRQNPLRIALAVESMRRHTTDEGWQIMQGLEYAGYNLAGHHLTVPYTDVHDILKNHEYGLGTVVVQDKREWEGLTAGGPAGFDQREKFTNVEELAKYHSLFKLTILKDAHQPQAYHRQSAQEIGAHAWIVYYHPRIVAALAPYVRPQHLIRTYHTVDSHLVPTYEAKGRSGCLMSGALSGAYPLRQVIVRNLDMFPSTTYLKHPGYHRNGCDTPEFLQILSKYKVAICTSSVYGYALRKIIEATACGCVVVTDLPSDDMLPYIDGNLVRIKPNIPLKEISSIVDNACADYNPTKQLHYSDMACLCYDYRTMGLRLTSMINNLRELYNEE